MTIILLRGLARESGHWLDFPQRLEQQLGTKVRCIDFPGCGAHYREPALDNIGAMSDHARAQIRPGDGQPLVVIGISMGAMVALDWAQRYPQELASVVLINSSSGDQPWWWRLRPRALFITLLALVAPLAWRERLMLGIISNARVQRSRHLRQWLKIQRRHPVSRHNMFAMLMAAVHFKPLPECKVKGLVLASSRDRMVSVRASQDLAARYHWPIHYHPIAGHDLPLDDPDWMLNEVSEWLAP